MTSGLGLAVPSQWSVVPLKHVTSVLTRGTAPNYVDDGPVRAVSQAANQVSGLDWSRTRFHGFEGNLANLKGVLRPGDVLINSTGTGTLGRVGYFRDAPDEVPCMADGHVTVARADSRVLDSRFAYYWLASRPFYDYIYAALVVGATNQIELNREKLRDAPVPLPPLEDQRRIADFLDAETERLDALIEARRVQVRCLAQRWESLLSARAEELIETGGLLPMRRVADSIEQGWSPQCEDALAESDEWAVLKTSAVSSGVFRPLEHKRLPVGVSPDSRYRLADGDVLMTRGSGSPDHVGVAALAVVEGRKLLLSDLLYRLRLGRGWSPEYVTLMLGSSPVRGSMNLLFRGQSGQTIKLRAEDVQATEIPIAPYDVQVRLAGELEVEQQKMIRARTAIQRSQVLLAERRQALITAAVTGQFDVSSAGGRNVTEGITS
ncbi:restriction endonuclease subunit S [Streptomyces sp. CA-253872]|uniref:restriction endonuclease subunit S n=1 Tax=Streptomyces sp. CA-253872 TaxID=3240067 RepID=UPI003D927DD9